MNWFVRLCWFIGDMFHLTVRTVHAIKGGIDRGLNRYKFDVGDWLHAENTVGKVMEVGWRTYDIRLYCKNGVYRYTATQEMAERTYKKVNKSHFRAVATIYDS